MSNASNVMRIEFKAGYMDSDGEIMKETERDFCILYNEPVITEEEVIELINSGEFENDDRIVVTTPTRADNLNDR